MLADTGVAGWRDAAIIGHRRTQRAPWKWAAELQQTWDITQKCLFPHGKTVSSSCPPTPTPPPRVKYYPVKSEDLKPLHETDNFWWHILRRCEIWVDVKDDTITTMPQKHWMMVFIFSAHFLFFSQPIITWRCNQLMVKLLLFGFFCFVFQKISFPLQQLGCNTVYIFGPTFNNLTLLRYWITPRRQCSVCLQSQSHEDSCSVHMLNQNRSEQHSGASLKILIW